MASWSEIAGAEAEFAARVQALFDAHRHKILATLRQDGSPRVSGIEVAFSDGDVWIGSMPTSRKAADLARDPRLALHCASDDPPDDPTMWQGDAKLSGRAVAVDDAERLKSMGEGGDGSGALYQIDITEVVLTGMGDPPDHLLVQVWTPERGLRQLIAS
ncbi:MAG TPA: pyridoxamine 5'-phosphate oxidase family protein [Dehalococcoidia bacterium]|nr:pyridoxamine 5'-phosphate oxidase family protein [Dehalococcoidia bacterium]